MLVVLQEEFIFYERGTKEEMVPYMLLKSMLSSHRSINKHLTQCLYLEHTTHNYFKIKSMNCIHSFSNFRPWAFFRILETILTAK